ncbi:hypothetical protein MRX96_036141 [Rhipicephalus microplus]
MLVSRAIRHANAAGRKEERPRVSKRGRFLPVIHRNLPEHASTTSDQWTAAVPDTPRGHGLPSVGVTRSPFRRRPQLARRDSRLFLSARMTVSGCGSRRKPQFSLVMFFLSHV